MLDWVIWMVLSLMVIGIVFCLFYELDFEGNW